MDSPSPTFGTIHEEFEESKMNFDDYTLNTFDGTYDNEGYEVNYAQKAAVAVSPAENSSSSSSSGSDEGGAQEIQGNSMNEQSAATLCLEVTDINGVRTWVCQAEKCGKQTNRRCNLITHILNIHSNERPLKCTHAQCEWKFARKTELNRHLGTHDSSKPHECLHCQKGFKRNSCLTRHLKTCRVLRSDQKAGHIKPAKLAAVGTGGVSASRKAAKKGYGKVKA